MIKNNYNKQNGKNNYMIKYNNRHKLNNNNNYNQKVYILIQSLVHNLIKIGIILIPSQSIFIFNLKKLKEQVYQIYMMTN